MSPIAAPPTTLLNSSKLSAAPISIPPMMPNVTPVKRLAAIGTYERRYLL